jgi:membrane protein DedA with SNARE-associated domain
VTEFIESYGLLMLFAVIAVQAAGIPGPPGKTALVAAAILAAQGKLDIVSVLVVAALAGIAGGYAGYAAGRFGGRRLVLRPSLARPLAAAEGFFALHGPKAVFLARFFPGLKVVAAPAAGIVHMPWRAFAFWHAAGAIAFSLVFGITAFVAGAAAVGLVEHYGVYALLPLALAAIAAALLVNRRRKTKRPAHAGLG